MARSVVKRHFDPLRSEVAELRPAGNLRGALVERAHLTARRLHARRDSVLAAFDRVLVDHEQVEDVDVACRAKLLARLDGDVERLHVARDERGVALVVAVAVDRPGEVVELHALVAVENVRLASIRYARVFDKPPVLVVHDVAERSEECCKRREIAPEPLFVQIAAASLVPLVVALSVPSVGPPLLLLLNELELRLRRERALLAPYEYLLLVALAAQKTSRRGVVGVDVDARRVAGVVYVAESERVLPLVPRAHVQLLGLVLPRIGIARTVGDEARRIEEVR